MSLDNKININGTWYVTEGLEKVTKQQVIDYLEDISNWDFVNIIQESIRPHLRSEYFDNSDILNGDVAMSQRQILAVFLAVNN